MRERSGGDTGCNCRVACAAGCGEGAGALFSERHALDASIAIVRITATRVRLAMWVTRMGPSYRKRPASERGGSLVVEAGLETRLDQKSNVNDTFMSRGATTAAGASQVVYVELALAIVSAFSTLNRSRLATARR